jgi:4-amino-4-deoxy-L-arabinose transferase-like glycosyltransferase
MKKKTSVFYLFFIAFVGILLCIPLFTEGMFMDGLIYASVSKNLAAGEAGFWIPKFSDTLYPAFHEHPPLFFGIQSLFFLVFGDSILTERIFSFFFFILFIIILRKLWISNHASHTGKTKAYAFLPLIAIILLPLISWGFSNNILEILLLIFCSLAIVFVNKAYSSKNKSYVWLFFAVLCIIAGFFVKGPVALFPLAAVFFHYIVFKKIKISRCLMDSFFLILISLILFFGIYFLIPNADISIKKYIDRQVVGSLENVQTVNSRFYLLGRLFIELVAYILISICCIILYVKKKISWKSNAKIAFYYLLIGLSASLPMLISMKQSEFYLLPSLPFFVLAFSWIVFPAVQMLFSKWNTKSISFKIVKISSMLFLALSIILNIYYFPKTLRDKEKIADMHQIASIIGKDKKLHIPNDLYADWSLHAYFYRYHQISLYTQDVENQGFYIQKKEKAMLQDSSFVEKKLDLELYQLYQKQRD